MNEWHDRFPCNGWIRKETRGIVSFGQVIGYNFTSGHLQVRFHPQYVAWVPYRTCEPVELPA